MNRGLAVTRQLLFPLPLPVLFGVLQLVLFVGFVVGCCVFSICFLPRTYWLAHQPSLPLLVSAKGEGGDGKLGR